MLDVIADDIARLDDAALRELVARLCEAELESRGLSAAAVTWGGSQTAPDGGVDVRVALPAGTTIEGFVPRSVTGFQVKKSNMARADIIGEMRPNGAIRPVIRELADEAGGYVIVSGGDPADSALRNRKGALREALEDVASADRLHTDFYGRGTIATWARRHPAVAVWVRGKIGRAHRGWRPYGAWAGAAEGLDAEYLVDDALRLHLDHGCEGRAVGEAIDALRDKLRDPRASVRLVGLSGVGKTRLVQALFDVRIGERPLPSSLAIYTDVADEPDPPPIALATDLIASGRRAILIVDNCGADLHRRLTEVCSAADSTLGVLTVEYDVREDQPEGTQVVRLDTSSPQLVERLLASRFPEVSQVDAGRIAEVSGGNARIAIALAETVGRTDAIAGLSDDALFQRLFRQRNQPDGALLHAAQACALVYSFDGESMTGDEAELPRLASLAELSPRDLYRHVGELQRRNLVQRRGVWRAVLPHAIANRLAARALDDTPAATVERTLVFEATPRLARSFTRRLSFLHDHPRAVAMVERWLAPGGRLGDVASLDKLGQGMFANVAPVSPEAALAALERAGSPDPVVAAGIWSRHRSLLRSLAWDPALFDRSVDLLVRAAVQGNDAWADKEAADAFVALFPLSLSGTHASIEQRLRIIERLLRSARLKERSLGRQALEQVLEATHFSSVQAFEFGGRSRDYGYRPAKLDEVLHWYRSAISTIERLAAGEAGLRDELRALVAGKLRGLWPMVELQDDLERLWRNLAAGVFWRDGWVACMETMRFDRDRMAPDSLARLAALEAGMRPSGIRDRVRAVVLGDRSGRLDIFDLDPDDSVAAQFQRREDEARALGTAIAGDDDALDELMGELLRGGSMVWAFGRGLAAGAQDPRSIWTGLVSGLASIDEVQRDARLLTGFVAGLRERDLPLAQDLLDAALDEPLLAAFVPDLHAADFIDACGFGRIMRAMDRGLAPVARWSRLAYGRATDKLSGDDIRTLVLRLAGQPDGFGPAREILVMRLHSDRTAGRVYDPALLDAGRELLRRLTFSKDDDVDDFRLAELARVCLVGPDAGRVAAEVARRLLSAVASYEAYAFKYAYLPKALLAVDPVNVLEALFEDHPRHQWALNEIFENDVNDRSSPLDDVPDTALVAWCDRDPQTRYPLAAEIAPFAKPSDEGGALAWTPVAKALLARAPDPGKVLRAFVERFAPTSWSGSRAALMEANGRLLDNLDGNLSPESSAWVADARAKLAQAVAEERRRESESARRDERFE